MAHTQSITNQNYVAQVLQGAPTPQDLGKETPKLEMLAGELNVIANQLAVATDQLAMKVSQFLNEPHPFVDKSGTAPSVQQAEPPLGSLASLVSVGRRLQEQQQRIALLVDKVKGIL